MAEPLRVLTLNTGRNEGAYFERLRLMIAGLQAARADILLLQECFLDQDGGIDTARSIAEALGLQYVQFPTRERERTLYGEPVLSSAGLAIVTRGAFGQWTSLTLPTSPEDGGRFVQIAEITLDGRRLLVANTHLTHLADGQQLRLAQLDEVFAGRRGFFT